MIDILFPLYNIIVLYLNVLIHLFAAMLYCCQAWSGFCSAADRQRLDSFIRRCIKLGLYKIRLLCSRHPTHWNIVYRGRWKLVP